MHSNLTWSRAGCQTSQARPRPGRERGARPKPKPDRSSEGGQVNVKASKRTSVSVNFSAWSVMQSRLLVLRQKLPAGPSTTCVDVAPQIYTNKVNVTVPIQDPAGRFYKDAQETRGESKSNKLADMTASSKKERKKSQRGRKYTHAYADSTGDGR